MTELIKIDSEQFEGMEPSKAEKIRKTFEPMVEMLNGFEEKFNDIVEEAELGITKSTVKDAKRLRLDIRKVRTTADDLRKKEKAEYLRAGKAIDGVGNILKWAVTEKEEKLQSIEKHFENIEKERVELLQSERVALLSKYVDDTTGLDLGNMADDVWEIYIAGKEKQFNDRIEAEKQAELDRIAREQAEAEERERVRVENERLKAEAAEAEKKRKAEAQKREEADAKRIAKEKRAERARKKAEKLRAEAEERRWEAIRKKQEAEKKKLQEIEDARIAKEKKAKAARDKEARLEREAHERQLEEERAERRRIEAEEQAKREALQAEIDAKNEAERVAKEAEEARQQAELAKGDTDKVTDLIADLEALKGKYSFDSKSNKAMYEGVKGMLDKMVGYVEKKVGTK